MSAWWVRLSLREQRLVLIAGIVLVLGALWWGLWQPQQQALTQSRAALARAESLYQWVQQQAVTVVQARADSQGQQPVFSGSLNQLANSSSKRFNIRISRLQPVGTDQLQLYLEPAQFNRLLDWLAYLRSRGIRIQSLDLSAADTPGMVQIRRLQLGKGS